MATEAKMQRLGRDQVLMGLELESLNRLFCGVGHQGNPGNAPGNGGMLSRWQMRLAIKRQQADDRQQPLKCQDHVY